MANADDVQREMSAEGAEPPIVIAPSNKWGGGLKLSLRGGVSRILFELTHAEPESEPEGEGDLNARVSQAPEPRTALMWLGRLGWYAREIFRKVWDIQVKQDRILKALERIEANTKGGK